jgi:hypothetical protein
MRASIVFALVLLVGCSSSDKKSLLIPSGDAGASGAGDGGGLSDAGAGGASANGDGTSEAGASGGVATSCDIDNMGTRYCIDWSASFLSNTMADCATNKGVFSDGLCDLTDVTGGCKQNILGGTQTVWFRLPITADSVMATCEADGNAVFVSP